MSDRYDNSRRRGALNHWVPLVLTLTIATAGIAAWAWSQRNHDDDYEDEEGEHSGFMSGGNGSGPNQGSGRPSNQQRPYGDVDYDHADYGDNPPYGVSTPQPPGSAVGNTINLADASGSYVGGVPNAPGSGWGARMTDALNRTGSPQHWVGNASKAVTAGISAASAAVGGALASIREGDKDAYADHETWSEEADARHERPAAAAAAASSVAAPFAKDVVGRKRKTVAIVVSAAHDLDVDEDGFHEHASILSYIPRQTDFSRTRIFVLVYAPGLKDSALLDPGASSFQQPNSLSSSFSNIAADAAQSPKQEAKAPSASVAYNALHSQALALVEKDSEIIPFTSPNGHAHILHLLEPDVVYLQESLTGDNGATVNQIQNWFRNDIIVVVGADNGHGGLADSESEAEKPAGDAAAAQKWWEREDRVGRGRGVVVVDGMRVNDDWLRRVQNKE
ncbi:hypothetical protein SPBR_00608 [Sporothrix brasiliensis 5110]|uniref:Peroxin 22-like protein n=1 Tax=Sporothrix brasiliensis 5110 TaxID=1398154 RepID=A0A0C2FIA9_9PEZI|nr:uncharacterized protein SPBR_00608 [Sporothrix brasiliensis 5110]KIH90788.1 hypothetical protein SPBR_00608 [Sporothrix brasiliensis 5110]